MKRECFLTGFIFLLAIGFTVGCQDFMEKNQLTDQGDAQTRSENYRYYYWYNGGKIKLSLVENKKYILFDKSNQTAVKDYLTNQGINSVFNEVTLSSKIRSRADGPVHDLMWATLATDKKLTDRPEVLYEAPYFLLENGEEVGLSHLFYVKLKSEDDLSSLEQLTQTNRVEIIGNNEYMPLWYTLSCTKNSAGNALDMANLFYETGFFAASEPDLMGEITAACVNDPYFDPFQWNLKNTGQNGGTSNIDINFCNARAITQGSKNVIVAVFDEGIELNHPDLNVHPVSFDIETRTSPSRVYGPHGTICAGFISAKTNNGIGIAATAPNSPVMSISVSFGSSADNPQKCADGINFAWRNNASVISNSWGMSPPTGMVNDAITAALTQGRAGNGCVVVFASGNAGGPVDYPANSNSDIIAVGSNTRNGKRSGFSNFGPTLDLVAPGEEVTSTTTGNSYIFSTQGTSYSCPTVAAVAALVLSVNPGLTQKEVVNILERTARKVGGYNYVTTSGRLNGTWNNEMGYGLVDASAAVLAARSLPINFFDKNVIADETLVGTTILVRNVHVSNNAKLALTASQSVKIQSPFEVSAGSRLNVKLM